MKLCLSVALVISLAVAGPACAQFYKYLDKQGNMRFTDDINQVPESQRAKVRSYEESRAPAASPVESGDSVEKKPAAGTGAAEAPALSAVSASGDEESLDSGKTRIEELKKQVDAEYKALVKEKESLAKEKEARKSREEINDYNKRVEAFNQRAAKYETMSDDLRKKAEEFNNRVMEENAKAPKPAKK
jgi:hypothetical protein